MRICFLLPGPTSQPVGGYKVVYEYANKSVERGHVCEIRFLDLLGKVSLRVILKRRIKRGWKGRKTCHRPNWFVLAPEVKLSGVRGRRLGQLSNYDVVVATSWETAELLGLSSFPMTRTAYLVQGYERWSGSAERVHATYGLPTQILVVSSWLRAVVAPFSMRPATLVMNGLDHEVFCLRNPVENRAPHVAFIWSADPNKDSASALAALRIVIESVPALRVTVICANTTTPAFPQSYEVRRCLTAEQMAEVFNQVTIFVSTSRSEGWGMPATEAMACGATLVSSAIPGICDYANADNCLTFPVGDVAALAQAILTLLSDDPMRQRLGASGLQDVIRLDWSRSASQLFDKLTEISARR